MGYRINVSMVGVGHIFATDESTLHSGPEAERAYDLIRERFSESGGFKVDVMFWEKRGKECTDSFEQKRRAVAKARIEYLTPEPKS